MTIQKRVSKTGAASYLIRVSLGYEESGQRRVVRSMTWKPEKGMTQKQIEREVNRQAVLFEERAKQEYAEQLKIEAERQLSEENAIEYAKQHTNFQALADEWLELQEVSREYKPSTLTKLKGCKERTYNAIGDVLVSKLNFRTIQAFITSLAKDGVNQQTGKGLSVKSQKSYLNFISDVMLYAKRCGIIEHNPCRDIVFAKTVSKEKAVYKDVDFKKSILTINRTSNYHQGFGTYTDTPKTKSSYRSLYIQPFLLDLIKQLQEEQKAVAEKCGDQWVESDRLFIN